MKIIKKKSLFCIIAVIIISISFNLTKIYAEQEKTPTGIPINEVENYIDKYMKERIGNTTVGASVAVVKDNKLILKKAYGYANLDEKIPLNADKQVFEWGSVTKLFTWVSVMQLVEEGKLDLNRDIKEYLPENFLTKLNYKKSITLLDLMNHTAGFEDYLIDLGFQSPDDVESLEDGLKHAEPEQVYEPGTVMSYSNYGAALAGYIVERVSGLEFYEYVNKNIFERLGMTQTTVHQTLADKPILLDNKPMGYSWRGNNNFDLGSWTYVSIYPCGSANGTLNDMAKFVCALMPNKNEGSALFKNKGTLDELLTTSYSISDKLSGVAHGFMESVSDDSIFYHPGNTICFTSMVAFKPNEKFAVIIASNQGNETEVVSGLTTELLFGKGTDVDGKITTELTDITTAGTYLPARYQHNGYLKILGYMSYLNLDRVDNKKSVFKQLGQELVFTRTQDGVYENDGEALYLSVDKNKVGKFWLNGFEYVPAPAFSSEPWIVGMLLIFLICSLYYIITNSITFIKWAVLKLRKKKKEKKELVLKLNTLLRLVGFLLVLNCVLLIMRSLPWPISSNIMIHIIFMYILAAMVVGLIGYIIYSKRKAKLTKKQSIFLVSDIVIAVLFIVVMGYWGF